ncbi:MAG: methylenetetrahydrofolate reductase [NAD(P)H] [bacterium]|nr:methylenetetrahydrofolate reductase [NAD(P)H] [bacterium]
MGITEIYATASGPILSYEFFPPKTDAGYRSLFRTIEELKQLDPGFVSVTMGAGGTTREKTVDLTIEITRDIGLVTMCHLPCTGYRPEQVTAILDQLEAGGVRNILALRGDPPKDDPDFVNPPEAFDYANELVEFIAARGGFTIGGACSPEIHPEAPDLATDLIHLKSKVDAGCEFVISNLFLDNQKFFDFEVAARAAGIECPIIPGIMPIATVSGIRRMAGVNNTSFPDELNAELDRVDGDDEATYALGVRWATEQCRELIEHGVPGIHLFTLNRSPASREIHHNLFD